MTQTAERTRQHSVLIEEFVRERPGVRRAEILEHCRSTSSFTYDSTMIRLKALEAAGRLVVDGDFKVTLTQVALDNPQPD